MARTDKIWLVRILLIGSFVLCVVNLTVLTLHHLNADGKHDPSAEVAGMPAEGDSGEVAPVDDPETTFKIGYPIFRGKWESSFVRKTPRGI